jgi:hypothetical protein
MQVGLSNAGRHPGTHVKTVQSREDVLEVLFRALYAIGKSRCCNCADCAELQQFLLDPQDTQLLAELHVLAES